MSSEHGSDTGSSLGLSSVNINRNKPHPEQWTVPQEWTMEKRECFDVSLILYLSESFGKKSCS